MCPKGRSVGFQRSPLDSTKPENSATYRQNGAERRCAEHDSETNTFVTVADEWPLTKKKALTPATWERDRRQIHKWVVPYLGNKPIASIEAPDLLEVLKRIESKGVIDTAHRTREVCGRVFRYAIATGRAKRDIAADLVGALAPRTTQHHAAIIDPVKVGELLRAIDGYDGHPTTGAPLKLAPYVFVPNFARQNGLRSC